MLKIWLPALAPLFKAHSNYIKFIKSLTDLILTASYHCHTETTLKYLQHTHSGISSNIHHILPFHNCHSICKIPKLYSLLLDVEYIREIGTSDNRETEIADAFRKTSS